MYLKTTQIPWVIRKSKIFVDIFTKSYQYDIFFKNTLILTIVVGKGIATIPVQKTSVSFKSTYEAYTGTLKDLGTFKNYLFLDAISSTE
jgi:hypothetical protein